MPRDRADRQGWVALADADPVIVGAVPREGMSLPNSVTRVTKVARHAG
ncbi:hypothetical protein JQN58_32860 [Aneurinibacillus sp. BA2021]|nr:hypothetical protein [Aneurinibacillus sp. BA2021]